VGEVNMIMNIQIGFHVAVRRQEARDKWLTLGGRRPRLNIAIRKPTMSDRGGGRAGIRDQTR